MNLKIRLEQLEIAKNQELDGYWSRPIGQFYGEDVPLVWVTRAQNLSDFYGQGLQGLNEMYEILPESRQPTD